MAKKNQMKLPKTIAGYKLSKGTRKNVSWAVRLLDSPEAKALLASGFAALVTRVADRREKSKRKLAKGAR